MKMICYIFLLGFLYLHLSASSDDDTYLLRNNLPLQSEFVCKISLNTNNLSPLETNDSYILNMINAAQEFDNGNIPIAIEVPNKSQFPHQNQLNQTSFELKLITLATYEKEKKIEIIVKVSVPDGMSFDTREIQNLLEEVLQNKQFDSSRRVEYCEEDFQILPLGYNDRLHSQQRHHLDQIDFPAQTLQHRTTVYVAVIDTGLEAHEDLNFGRIPLEGARIATTYAYNSERNRTGIQVVSDEHGHGTCVTGLIGAVINNNLGITGLNITSGVRVIPIKAGRNSFALSSVVRAIYYLHNLRSGNNRLNLRVLNLSLGFDRYSSSLFEALRNLANLDVVITAGAGNTAVGHERDISRGGFYPASYNIGNLVPVSVGRRYPGTNNGWTSNSNFHPYKGIMAPGHDVLTLGLNNGYWRMSLTSISTPFVTAAVANYLSLRPSATASQAIDALFANCIRVRQFANKARNGCFVNFGPNFLN
ncbi:MAG: S8 family serine peptidase [Deltaproteobacteria bacterium]|nr:S8 family serine peptidase [Deltaproteobacteria bacterium]